MGVTVREERDPAFWQGVLEHPAVCHVTQGIPHDDDVFGRGDVLPLASEHGGYVFVQRDALGRLFEIHAMFKPEGWGREAHDTMQVALFWIFERCGADLLVAYKPDHEHATAPRSFGFRKASDARETPWGAFETWILTRDAWRASAPGRRQCRSLLH